MLVGATAFHRFCSSEPRTRLSVPYMSAVSPDAPLILVVDDNKPARMLLRSVMEAEGYRVAEAENGEQCLLLYTRLCPDIVLLDALMPVMDGFTCCQRLQALPRGDRIPLLMITSLDDQSSVDEAFAAGATDYITKPIHWPVLRQRVRRLLQASRAMEELRQQTEWERLMGVMSQRIRQSLNLEDILNTTVVEVRQVLQTDRVSIYRFKPDWSGTMVVESVGAEWPAIATTIPPDLCFDLSYIQQFQQGQQEAIADIQTSQLPDCHLTLLNQLQVRASLVVPILQGDRLWGLLIAHHCAAPRRWQPSEIKLVERLATQVAIAIQQSELYQQVQHLNADLECQVEERTAQLQQSLDFESRLKRITDKVRDSLDEQQILQTATEELASALGVYCCSTALYNGEPTSIKTRYEFATVAHCRYGAVLRAKDFLGIDQQILQGQYAQFCEAPDTAIGDRAAMLVCPIFDDRGVLGELWLLKSIHLFFNELEVRLVLQVANQCAIAIRQARLFQAAQAQVEALERLNRLKDEFLSTVSHELRTPMASMKMATRMLEVAIENERESYGGQQIVKTSTQKTERYLQILRDECEREISLINDLLDLQRLDAGTQSLHRHTIQVRPWLSALVNAFEERSQAMRQTFQLIMSPTLPTLVSDQTHLERILIELLNNACKHSPPEAVITVRAQATGDTLQMIVSNSGVEIPPSEQLRIFDKFYRIPSNDPWKQGGTGLGLALVKKLVTHLSGNIRVDSSAQLTSFTLELPLE